MNHIIFGSEGFVGKNLYAFLNELKVGPISQFDLKSDLQTNKVDVRKPISHKLPFSTEETIIYNLAAVHVTPGHLDHEYFESNVFGAKNICNFARENKINTIVFTSSIAVYGASESLKTEESLLMPATAYGISKLTSEYIHTLWQAEDPENRKLIIVRPGAIFGKGENGNFTRLYRAIKSGYFFYPGRKNTKKASVYIKDVVRILYQTATQHLAGVHIYNLCFEEAPSIETICGIIAQKIGINKPKLTVPASLLKCVARILKPLSRKKLQSIHPDRIVKLMVSTDISGAKLANSPYKLNFNLDEAISDWFNECEKKGLY